MEIVFKHCYLRNIFTLFLTLGVVSVTSISQAQSLDGVDQNLTQPMQEVKKESSVVFSNYVLGPEDIIEIEAVKHPEFSGVFSINQEGKIQYKSLGDISVVGLKKDQLEDKIKELISKYAVNPEVHVTVTEFKSNSFYVLGEVKNPGKYNMRAKSISVGEAVMMAGLPTPTAAMRKAMIIAAERSSSDIKEIDLYAVLYEGDSKNNGLLNAGDTLFVPSVLNELSENKKENGSEYSKYTLGPDDIVEITVFQHPELSGSFPVSPEGKIQYKFLGDLNVNGITKSQLEDKVKEIVAKHVVSPQVNITVTDFKSKVFYVLGEVDKPGKYYMRAESLTIKEAAVMAQLPTQTAALRKAKIHLADGTSKDVDLYAALYAGDLKANVQIHPGDTLYVPATVAESKVDITKKVKANFDPLIYTLGPDDVIDIAVSKHPEFSGTFPVSLEGKVQYKFVGDLNVTGMTKGQLEDKIKNILSGYVASPEIDVTIKEFKSKAFYVLGEVGSPGKFFMRADHITVSEAIVLANLPTLAAAMRKTQIITPGVDGTTVVRKVNLYNLLYKGDLNENLVLSPGDYLFVPSTVLTKFIRVINPVSETVGLAATPAASAAVIAK